MNQKLKELTNEMDRLEDIICRKNASFFSSVTNYDNPPTFDEYLLNTIYERERLIDLKIDYINLVDVEKVSRISPDDDYYSMESFVNLSEIRALIDSDGIGYLCCDGFITDFQISPSAVIHPKFNKTKFHGVVWFNK